MTTATTHPGGECAVGNALTVLGRTDDRRPGNRPVREEVDKVAWGVASGCQIWPMEDNTGSGMEDKDLVEALGEKKGCRTLSRNGCEQYGSTEGTWEVVTSHEVWRGDQPEVRCPGRTRPAPLGKDAGRVPHLVW